MDELYVVYENEVWKLVKNEFTETKWYLMIDGHKVYKSQMNDLTLLGLDVVVITTDSAKIDYWQNEIQDFYNDYRRKRG